MLITGNAGNIEIAVDSAASARVGAIVCHPHPLYGGTMDDAVVAAICAGFARAGFASLRFNFRGVGQSEGDHDRGAGEADDVVTLSDWFRGEYALERVWLAGYSFGAGVVLGVAPRIDCAGVVAVAPPVQMVDPDSLPDKPTMVLLGDSDQVVNCDAARTIFEGRKDTTIRVLAGEDHLFRSAGEDIAATVAERVRGT